MIINIIENMQVTPRPGTSGTSLVPLMVPGPGRNYTVPGVVLRNRPPTDTHTNTTPY